MCVFAHAIPYSTRSASRVLSADMTLTVEARQRRVVRMPLLVRAAASVHFAAAAMNALAADRVLREMRGLGLVVVMAIVAA